MGDEEFGDSEAHVAYGEDCDCLHRHFGEDFRGDGTVLLLKVEA